MNNRIFLLNPPSQEYATTFPLGLAYLSAVLREHGYEVRVMDAAALYNPKSPQQIKEAIKDFHPLFVGVTLKYDFISEKYKLVREIKELGFPVVGGGPHVNILPHEALENGFDIVSIGEGEEAIIELAGAFKNGKNLEEIQGIGLKKKDGSIVFTAPRRPIEKLDLIPFPDYSDFNAKDYLGTDDYTVDKTFFDIFTSRGCPYKCTYCSASRVWKGGQRRRSAPNVFYEIVYLMERYGAQYVAFMDNEPLIDKQRIYELCDLLSKNKIKIKISTRARIDNIDEDLLKRLMEVGFYKLAIGVENGDDESLERVRRFYTQKDILKSMEILDRVRFPVIHFNNLIGFPWETKKHFNNTLKMNLKIPRSLTYFVNVVTPEPMPGTPLYEDYYERFGFKEWWLNSAYYQQDNCGKEERRPFFRLFMPGLNLNYLKVNFWKYSAATKRRILNLQLKLPEIAYKKNKNFSYIEIGFIFLLIRFSLMLYLFSPKAERLVFYLLKNRFMIRYAKKFVFKEQ